MDGGSTHRTDDIERPLRSDGKTKGFDGALVDAWVGEQRRRRTEMEGGKGQHLACKRTAKAGQQWKK